MLVIVLNICNARSLLFINKIINIIILLLVIIFILIQFIAIIYCDLLIRRILTKEEYELYNNTSKCNPIISIERDKIINKINYHLHKWE